MREVDFGLKNIISMACCYPFIAEEPVALKAVEAVGSQAHVDVLKALFRCVGLADSEIQKMAVNTATGKFVLSLKRPFMGRALAITDEAPAGVILQLGYDPRFKEVVEVQGTISKESIIFHQGLSMFVMTFSSRLSLANKAFLRLVMALPGMLRNPILRATGAFYDRETDSVETHVKIDRITFEQDNVLQSFSLFGSMGGRPAPKRYPLRDVVEAWSQGQPVAHDDNYKDVLRQQHINEA